ncbi:MAG: ATP-binding protein, partial [Promethearchaeota archaeon]
SNIINSLKEGRTVIVDTSLFEGAREIFVATIIVENIFNEYKRLKFKDQLNDKPVITIVLEEAPRVIGKKVLEARENVFGKIAREGRKFNIGLIGITQLPSLIDREILANMNTKIILGNEMGPERRTLIESSAQDLSDDSQTIASLDIGEAIVTSNFTKFAIPIRIPLFEDLIKGKSGQINPDMKIKKSSPGF